MKHSPVLVVLLFVLTGAAFAAPLQCALPGAVQASLDERWSGWRLLQLADLRSDDQSLWQEHRLNGKRCPGVNEGKFDGERMSLVFTLIRRPNEQVVLVATPNGDSFKVASLAPPQRVAYFSVVNVFPPGKYKEFYTDRRVRIPNQSAAVEAIEHSITLFYIDKGRWKSLLISD
jgi:hypothetical protein